MKRRISLLLALVIVLGSFSTAFAAVPTTAEGKAEFLNKQNILKGSESGDLMLEKKENRQNMVVMLSRLMQKETEAKAHGLEESAKFEDLTNKYYKPYVAWSVANNLIMGQSETKFGSHDNVTAQNYATVLLRALEYFSAGDGKVEHENAFELANKLGLFEETEIKEAKEEISRKQMSVMIYNALGTKMNGKDITLAEHLGITMPVDETLEVKSVKTANLGEIIVELSNAKAVANQKELLNVDNYNVMDGSKDRAVREVKLDGNNLIVVLNTADSKEAPLVKGREYKLAIRNIEKAINGDYTFKAEDNEFPVAEKVEALGEYGIKVVFSEPIKETSELETRFVFKSDAKNEQVAMKVNYFGGRELTLIPYHRGETFPLGKATLVVKSVEDLSGLKSTEKTFTDLEVKSNSVKPVIKDIEVKNTRVVVTFEEDVYSRSINVDNITWAESFKGGKKVEATSVKQLDGNKVAYEFAGEAQIPADVKNDRVEITITGVTNFSRKAMDKYVAYHAVDLDYTRPDVKGFYVETVEKGANVTEAIIRTRLHLTKDLDKDYVEKVNKDAKELADHIKLYGTKVNRYDELIKGDLIKGAIKSVELVDGNELLVSFNKDVIKAGENYVLEARGFRDATTLRNRMVEFESRFFREGQTKGFYVTKASHKFIDEGTRRGMIKVSLDFSEPVNRNTATNKTNYVFTLRNGDRVDMLDMEGHSHNEIVVRNDGKSVDLYVAEGKVNEKELFSLRLKDSIKDVDGNRLREEYIYHFDGRTDLTIQLDNAKISLDKEIKLMEAGIAKVKQELKEDNLHAESKIAMDAAVALAERHVDEAKALLKEYETTTGMTLPQLTVAIEKVVAKEAALKANREDNLELAKAKGDVEHDLVGDKDRLDAADFINVKAQAEALLNKNISNSDKISLEAAIAKLEEALKVEGTNKVKKEALEAAKVRLEAAIDDTVVRPETEKNIVEATFDDGLGANPTLPNIAIKDARITKENLTEIKINGKIVVKDDYNFDEEYLRVIVGEPGTDFNTGTIIAGGVEYKIVVK